MTGRRSASGADGSPSGRVAVADGLTHQARSGQDCNRLQSTSGARMSGLSAAPRIGWIGAGRMGAALAGRLVEAGHDVTVYNRTRSKAEAVAGGRATVVDRPVDLADRDIVFSMVSASADLEQVTSVSDGLLTDDSDDPEVTRRLVDGVDEASQTRARRGGRARHHAAGSTGERQPLGRGGRQAVPGRVRSPRGLRRGAAAARAPGPGRDVRRRGRGGPPGEDLPQRLPGRRHPVAGRDHAAGPAGRRQP